MLNPDAEQLLDRDAECSYCEDSDHFLCLEDDAIPRCACACRDGRDAFYLATRGFS